MKAQLYGKLSEFQSLLQFFRFLNISAGYVLAPVISTRGDFLKSGVIENAKIFEGRRPGYQQRNSRIQELNNISVDENSGHLKLDGFSRDISYKT